MSGFLEVLSVVLPAKELANAYQHFRKMGQRGCEGVALWVGTLAGNRFEILGTVIPEQSGIRGEDGLAYAVEAHALRKLNMWLYEKQLRLIAQVHSHPGEAYHSDVDDEYPIMTTKGGFSVVVPDFGAGRPSLAACAVYRLSASNEWDRLSGVTMAKMFAVL